MLRQKALPHSPLPKVAGILCTSGICTAGEKERGKEVPPVPPCGKTSHGQVPQAPGIKNNWFFQRGSPSGIYLTHQAIRPRMIRWEKGFFFFLVNGGKHFAWRKSEADQKWYRKWAKNSLMHLAWNLAEAEGPVSSIRLLMVETYHSSLMTLLISFFPLIRSRSQCDVELLSGIFASVSHGASLVFYDCLQGLRCSSLPLVTSTVILLVWLHNNNNNLVWSDTLLSLDSDKILYRREETLKEISPFTKVFHVPLTSASVEEVHNLQPWHNALQRHQDSSWEGGLPHHWANHSGRLAVVSQQLTPWELCLMLDPSMDW